MASVIGIDPSLGSLGIARRVFDNGAGIVAEALRGGKKGMPEMAILLKRTLAYVDMYHPELVAIEGYAYGAMRGHTQALLDIAELCGTLKLSLVRRGIDVLVVPPATMKKFVTGKGNASKDDVRAALDARYGWGFRYSDQYDAAGLLLVAEAYVDPLLVSRNRKNETRLLLAGCTMIRANAIDCSFC